MACTGCPTCPHHIPQGSKMAVPLIVELCWDSASHAKRIGKSLEYTENSTQIIQLLSRLAHEENCCVVVVTHDLEVAKAADVVFRITI